jgi:dihydroorotase
LAFRGRSIHSGSRRSGSGDIASFAASRPPLAEAIGIAKAILAASETGAAIHIRQVNSALGVETLRRLKSLADVSAETTPQNLLFVADDYARLGNAIKASPPFRSKRDIAAWRSAAGWNHRHRGHRPRAHAPAEKANDMRVSPMFRAGCPACDPVGGHASPCRSGYSNAAGYRRLCGNPRNAGLDGRKGGSSGADADIVIVDPARS